ncbi:hypothetical protein [Pseudomonas fildesensis]|uniref:Uncharacterized protein n=1 Tax=Pseudomonas fildesensis TaxID=1674920 RepID=A0A0J8G1G8_9PSED|nr:hypothetical protein [Pseudomonas fildesensis]KMT54864.1 hypothetical protein ACR52_15345 [Pseudomonas fildesensis]
MKSQDVVILFKLISLDLQARGERVNELGVEKIDLNRPHDWKGWDDIIDEEPISPNSESYSVRALSASLALSKSEVSNSLNRCRDIGLIHTDRVSGKPSVRSAALLDFVRYGIRYVFPAKPGPIVRGIPTAFAAPVLAGKVMSGGDLIPVWPDAYGKSKGQEISPLYKTVPGAVKKDELLYHFLALVDAIRIGGPREAKVADAMLREWIL